MSFAAPVGAVRQIPAYDLELPRHTLQIGVYETTYQSTARITADGYEFVVQASADTAEGLVASYLDAVLHERSDQLRSFYRPADFDESKARMFAQLARVLIIGKSKEIEQFEIYRSWRFRSFEMFLVRFDASDGSSKFISVSVETIGTQYFRQDNWGKDWNIVQLLFWTMAGNEKARLVAQHAPRALPFEFVIGRNETPFPLIVSLEGQQYEPTDEWRTLDPNASVDAPVEFARRAFAVADSKNDESFLALFHGKKRAELEEDLTLHAAQFKGLRSIMSKVQEIQPLFTAYLGESAILFYTDKQKPSTIETLQLFRADGRYWLADELSINLWNFFRSAAFIAEVWRTFGKDSTN